MLIMSKTGPDYVLQQIFSVNWLVQFFLAQKIHVEKKNKNTPRKEKQNELN